MLTHGNIENVVHHSVNEPLKSGAKDTVTHDALLIDALHSTLEIPCRSYTAPTLVMHNSETHFKTDDHTLDTKCSNALNKIPVTADNGIRVFIVGKKTCEVAEMSKNRKTRENMIMAKLVAKGSNVVVSVVPVKETLVET